MNANELTPQQQKMVVDLNKRIAMLELHLKRLQCNMIKVDNVLPAKLAGHMSDIYLN